MVLFTIWSGIKSSNEYQIHPVPESSLNFIIFAFMNISVYFSSVTITEESFFFAVDQTVSLDKLLLRESIIYKCKCVWLTFQKSPLHLPVKFCLVNQRNWVSFLNAGCGIWWSRCLCLLMSPALWLWPWTIIARMAFWFRKHIILKEKSCSLTRLGDLWKFFLIIFRTIVANRIWWLFGLFWKT